ncbi:MAG: tyrosine-type recombinase/integrase [Clostridiales bacterium]|nr:tyrosine-type recombinase/integrase [Clostridiales bacterium]
MAALMSIFKNELNDYLAIRQKTMTPESHYRTHTILAGFDRYLSDVCLAEKVVTEKIINGWINRFSATNSRKTVSDKVSRLRKFLEYLLHCGYTVFMPGCPKYSDEYVPYIFSDAEVAGIFEAADNLRVVPGHPSTRYLKYTFPMLLRLLHGCGLRLGETLSLRVRDVNFKNGTLLLRHTKNNKQRLVPMHRELTEILRRYCAAMMLVGKPDEFLFPTDSPEKPLPQASARNAFGKALACAGVNVKIPGRRGPCLHCFRHLFAIKSFAQAENNGRAPDASVPFLSVYLGHYDMNGTEKYLKFSGDMFPRHTEMFETFAVGVFSEVPDEV